MTESRGPGMGRSDVEARVRTAWTGKPGPALRLASTLYGLAHDTRDLLYDAGIIASRAMPIPTVSVGGLTTGGSGKTPVTAAIAGWLAEAGAHPAVITGGIPDEAAVHRLLNPDLTVVDRRDRRSAIRKAMSSGAAVAVLDSGLQHRRARSDLQIVCVDVGSALLPGRRRLPAGPFRERWSALDRADAVIVVRRAAEGDPGKADREISSVLTEIACATRRAFTGVCTIRPGRVRPVNAPAERAPMPGSPVAVAGVMWPERFFASLDQLGIRVAERLAFRDHEPFGPRDRAEIRKLASEGVICTLKDAVKLGPLLADEVPVWYLEETAVWDSGQERLRDGVLQIVWTRPPHERMDSVHGDRD